MTIASNAITAADIDKVMKELTAAGYVEKFAKAGEKSIQQAFKKVGQASGENIEAGFVFDLEAPGAVKEIAKIISNFSKTARKSALKDIKKALAVALEEGQSIQDAQVVMRGLYAKKWKSRADSIARTEIMRAANHGALEAYKQSGVVTKKVWIAAGDACPICVPLHGMVVSIEESFFTFGEEIPYTDANGDSVGFQCDYADVEGGDAHPNCRCTIGAVTEVSGG